MAKKRAEEYRDVIAIINTHHPERARLKKVITSLSQQVKGIVVVDHGAPGIDEIRKWAGSKIKLIKIPENIGLCAELNIGIKAAKRIGARWFLISDQDTLMRRGAVRKVLGEYGKLPEKTKKGVGMVAISFQEKDRDRHAQPLPENGKFLYKSDVILSGDIVKSEVLDHIGLRDDFFIDMLDFEFDIKLHRLGYSIIEYDEKLMSQEFGKPVMVRGKPIRYYNEKRLYYVTRNSTCLLLHYGFPFREHMSMVLTLYSRFIRVNGIGGLLPMSTVFVRSTADGILGHMGVNKRYENYETQLFKKGE